MRVITFELTQHIRPRCLNVTDGRTTYDSNTALALRALHGNNTTNNEVIIINGDDECGFWQPTGGLTARVVWPGLRVGHYYHWTILVQIIKDEVGRILRHGVVHYDNDS